MLRLPSLIAVLLLSAYRGGNSPKVEPEPFPIINEYQLHGVVVKEPVANASISVYEIDFTKDNHKGNEVASGSTTELATIVGVSISEPLSEYYLIELTSNSETKDRLTNKKPIIETMYSLVSAEQLKNKTAINLTPLQH